MTEEIGNSELLRTWANNGTVVVPANAKIDEGWLRGEQPPHEWMNYIHNVLGQKVNHALSRGAADWNSGTEYLAGALVNRSGDIWLALAPNTNSEPSSGNSNWSGLFSRANTLGTVSQSAGVPTGAIIERGSNSNGEFVRFADGTQICTHQLALPKFTRNRFGADWDFPASFINANYTAVITPNDFAPSGLTSLERAMAQSSARSTTSLFANQWKIETAADILPDSDPQTVDLVAIGRWF